MAFLLLHDEYDRARDTFYQALASERIGDYYKVYMAVWVLAEGRRLGRADDDQARAYLAGRDGPLWFDDIARLASGRRALLAHPGDYPPCPRGLQQETLLVVGPEGGFIPYEVDKLEAAGCQAVSLGPRILRVENALSTLLGRLF